MRDKHAIKMICNNPDCINKSPTYRRFDAMGDYICKGCKKQLSLYKGPVLTKRDMVAKKQLREFGML